MVHVGVQARGGGLAGSRLGRPARQPQRMRHLGAGSVDLTCIGRMQALSTSNMICRKHAMHGCAQGGPCLGCQEPRHAVRLHPERTYPQLPGLVGPADWAE